MCPSFQISNNFCKIYCGNKYKMYNDGICRVNHYRMPNQRVCPIGKVLCADLSCRDNYNDCIVSEVPVIGEIRCIGQELVKNISDCSSTTTCSKETDVVCPDGTCVENEIFCPPVKECTDERFPYLCENNHCAKDFSSCNKTVACGHMYSLCENGKCKEKC